MIKNILLLTLFSSLFFIFLQSDWEYKYVYIIIELVGVLILWIIHKLIMRTREKID